MPIILRTENDNIRFQYLNIFPDQFKSEKDKLENTDWIKCTMDYFANVAYAQYVKNRDTFVKNYDLMKGILKAHDFAIEDDGVRDFMDVLKKDLDLPAYVKHYSILNSPINELVGELTKRPDTHRIKAMDDDSRSEEMEAKTKILQDYTFNKIKQEIMFQIQQQSGESQLSNEEIEQINQMTMEKVKDYMDSYTTMAERWANHILECQKVDFNMKEKSEEGFRDLCIANREFFHIYEDNSKLGFNVDLLNTKNEWHLTTPDKKYTSDPSMRNKGAYAAGTVEVMEISEIIENIPDLTKEEIDHLRESLEDYGLIDVRESNLFANRVGQDSIIYDTYDPLVLQERMIIESELKENKDELRDWLGLTSNVSAFGYKYVVVTAYFISKKEVGYVTYLDEQGNVQSTMVDADVYKKGDIDTEISYETGWINQWYQGRKIGPSIYQMKPFKLLPYCPVIGVIHEIKNTESRSLVDLMKPFQMIYNVCWNQLWRVLEKEIGVVYKIQLRRVPVPKDGDAQDAFDAWYADAQERGIVFEDDSPENLRSPMSNTVQSQAIDLSRSAEIQSRLNIAAQVKMEAWELVGISKQRVGSVSPSETATGTNAALQGSYAQTEPLFAQHEYLMDQVYQAIVDAAQYIESKKPLSTVSYITNEGEAAFIELNGTDLSMRDLKCFSTSRPQDQQAFTEIRQLAQPMLQNGADPYDVAELYATNSLRQMKSVLRKVKEHKEELEQQQQQLQQQQLDQQQQQFEAQMQENARQAQITIENENINKQLDRENKKEVALIGAYAKNEAALQDVNANGVADALEIARFSSETDKLYKEQQNKVQELTQKQKEHADKMQIERERLAAEDRRTDAQLRIAKLNSKNKPKK